MWLEVTIGLINVFMGLNIFQILPETYKEPEKWAKAVITTASALLVFGAVWATRQHRANILLIWLAAVVIYFGAYIYVNKLYLSQGIYGIFLGLMGALIYKVYTKELEESKAENSPAHEAKCVGEKPQSPSAPEPSPPPSYEAMVPQVHVT